MGVQSGKASHPVTAQSLEGVASMRNTILALAAAGSLTFVALTPALAVGLQCSDYSNLDRCPIYGGVYGNSTPLASPYQVSPRHVRHAQNYRGRYLYH